MATYAGKEVITLVKGLRTIFMEAFNNGEDPKNIMPFIMETSSNSDKEKYGWLGESPSLTEWVDERKIKTFNQFDYEIPNKDYEATLGVSKNAIKDDQYGMIKTRVQDLGRKAKIHPRAVFFNTLKEGTTELCYDGQAFFSASHQSGKSGVQTNLQTGTGTTLALLKADIDTAEANMMSFKDDTGEPFNEGEIEIGIICHPDLKSRFHELNTLQQINSSSNGMKGRIKQITTSSRFTDKNDWYFADVSSGLKPIIMQNRQSAEFNSLEDDSTGGFMRKKWFYGIDYRMGMGYGMWQKMIKVTNA